jgi:arylformamidase
MKIHDISLGISPGMVVWPNNPGVELERVNRIEDGANSNVSRLALGVHTGTHLDAPVHFVPGATGVEALPLEVLVGRCLVVHLPRTRRITAADLAAAGIAANTRRLLIKTRNSAYWARGDSEFHTDFVAIDPTGAQWLVDRGLELVGVDYLSVAPWKESRPTHQILLKAGVVVVEGLNLSKIKPGRYDLTCLPLKLIGSDGSPCRAILVER